MVCKIYAVKASRPGARIGGWRVKATDMQEATKKVRLELAELGGGWNVQISELKNQTAALKKWDAENA